MFFILPIGTSVRPWHKPYANYALIGVNILIFIFSYSPHYNPLGQFEPLRHWAQEFMLNPENLQVSQFVTYAFLHGGPWHIGGNMFFLYIFGRNVNDKLGNVGYISLYLAGAVFSALGHCVLSGTPVLGASGAVAAVTGAYLALFPKTLITIFYWLFIVIDTIEIPALYFIVFKLIIWDNVIERSMAKVAYEAHLSGYAFGIGAMLILMSTGLIKTSGVNLWSMIKRWYRRKKYQHIVSGGYNPFAGQTVAKKVNSQVLKKPSVPDEKKQRMNDLREEITRRINERNLGEAAEAYLRLMKIDKKQILPRQYLLDIANHLASENKADASAMAYEQFLEHYSNYAHAEQIELMLGLLYARYLRKPQEAEKHLQLAEKKLSDPAQLDICREELERLRTL